MFSVKMFISFLNSSTEKCLFFRCICSIVIFIESDDAEFVKHNGGIGT